MALKFPSISRQLTSRERRLAGITGTAIAVGLLYWTIVKPGWDRWSELESQIGDREEKLADLQDTVQEGDDVEKEYRQYKELLSEEETREEIHTNLRDELRRIAGRSRVEMINYGRPDEEFYDHFREYIVTIQARGRIPALAVFLRGIQESPKLLRIDELNIRSRSFGEDSQRIVLRVSRALVSVAESVSGQGTWKTRCPSGETESLLILEGRQTGVNLIQNPGFELWAQGIDGFPDGWEGDTLPARDTQHVGEGQSALKIQAQEPEEGVYQTVSLEKGTQYLLRLLAAAANGYGTLSVADSDGIPISEELIVSIGGRDLTEYYMSFEVPETGEYRVPMVQLDTQNAMAYLDGASLKALGSGK